MASILYLHGFLSSPSSKKALQTKRWLNAHSPDIRYLGPELTSYPHLARQAIDQLVEQTPNLRGVIGSSLGGFWAAYITERYGLRSVLVNPAVAPHSRFQHMLGVPQFSYYSDDVYTLGDADLRVLEACDQPLLADPLRYKVLLQTADETLDYRLAERRYKHSDLLVEEGGSHSFEGYEDHLPKIFEFLSS